MFTIYESYAWKIFQALYIFNIQFVMLNFEMDDEKFLYVV